MPHPLLAFLVSPAISLLRGGEVVPVPVSVEVKDAPDPRSLDGLIAWLKTQPGNQTYDMMSIDDCLICRYSSFMLGRPVGFGEAWMAVGHDGPHCDIAYAHPYSNAGALSRAIKYKSDHNL